MPERYMLWPLHIKLILEEGEDSLYKLYFIMLFLTSREFVLFSKDWRDDCSFHVKFLKRLNLETNIQQGSLMKINKERIW